MHTIVIWSYLIPITFNQTRAFHQNKIPVSNKHFVNTYVYLCASSHFHGKCSAKDIYSSSPLVAENNDSIYFRVRSMDETLNTCPLHTAWQQNLISIQLHFKQKKEQTTVHL